MLALLAPIITGTATFSLGALDVGPVDGFTPGGHFDVGISLHDVRVQAELDAGLWSNENAATAMMPESGSYRRIGGALRYYFANLDVAPDEKSRLRLFLEGGIGRQTIRSASVDVERPDLAIGFGMAQQARVGSAVLGGYFAVRVQYAEAPEPIVTGKQPVEQRGTDLGLFVMLGMTVGR